jgi:hypothetical protein
LRAVENLYEFDANFAESVDFITEGTARTEEALLFLTVLRALGTLCGKSCPKVAARSGGC